MDFRKANRLAYANFLRAQFERWTNEVLVHSYPYYLGIDPSSICQLRCPLCPTGVENEHKKSGEKIHLRNRTRMDIELFETLLGELGDYLFLIMFYNWGEPLFNKALPQFISMANELDIYTEIHTNLSFRLTDKFAEELLSSGIDEIAASIDGFSRESYSTYRRGGNFDLAKSNITRLAKLREKLRLDTKIIWNFLVFSFNEHEIDATRQYCEDNGIHFNRREAFIDNPDWLPSYRKSELPMSDETQSQEPSQTGQELSNPGDSNPPSSCAWHYCYSVVNADGAVSPCCAPWEQEHDFGTIQPGYLSFADVWNNNMFRKSRGVFAQKKVKGLEKIDTLCMNCPYGVDIQNLYTPLDKDVKTQFYRVYENDQSLLRQAFDLLDEKTRFVNFFRENMAYFSTDILDIPAPLASPQSGVEGTERSHSQSKRNLMYRTGSRISRLLLIDRLWRILRKH